MLSEGIRPIGDGLLEVAAERLQGLLVTEDINEIYDVEQTPFARLVWNQSLNDKAQRIPFIQ